MPLYDGAILRIRSNFERLSRGERAPVIEIGQFTIEQHVAINVGRELLNLHKLEENEILFVGRHMYESRMRDGYSVDDIIDQIVSSLSALSIADIQKTMSSLRNPTLRADRYGNTVSDLAVFEMTAKKPRAELFSVIPKGDKNKPAKR